MTSLFAIIGLFLGLALSASSIYKRLVKLRNSLDSSWVNVDAQLEKRYDLASRIANGVRECSTPENALSARLVETLSSAKKASSPGQKRDPENRFQDALKNILAVVESCPNLKTNGDFAQILAQLKEIEREIDSAGEYYNTVVRDYNATISSFPASIIASRFRFEKADSFELNPAHEEKKTAR